jgi:hypothetical protein
LAIENLADVVNEIERPFFFTNLLFRQGCLTMLFGHSQVFNNQALAK